MVEACKTKADFDAKKADAQKHGKYLLVDFTAQWCGPCKMIGPKLEELSKLPEYADKVIVIKVDVDDNEETAAANGISAMPTFILFDKDGNKVETLTGASLEKLKAMFEKTK